jgi:hypothetical protein
VTEPYKLVKIEWIDSGHVSGWTRRSDLVLDKGTDLMCVTVGFVLHHSELSISVCQSFKRECYREEDRMVDAVMEIPMVAVKSIREIEGVGS